MSKVRLIVKETYQPPIEISGHLEKTNRSATMQMGQISNSSGWLRTTDPKEALEKMKSEFPLVDIIKHEHVNFNGHEKTVEVYENYKKDRDE